MNRKVVLIIVVILALICICFTVAGVLLFTQAGNLFSQVSSSDPVKAEQTAQAIADIDPPPGFTSTMSVNLLGITMAGYTAPDERTTIFLFQVPPGTQMSMEQLQKQIEDMATRQSGERFDFEEVGDYPTTIRGQAVSMKVFEGTTQSGEILRQVVGAFEGKGGPAWIVITGPDSSWDQAGIDRFVSSMR